ncbi:hypothetical protein D3C79_560360 [compost metagenome]
MVIFREVNVDDEFFTGFMTNQTFFEAWDHAALAHGQYEVRGFAAFEHFAVDRTGEVNGYAVFSLRCAIAVFPGRLLLTQGVQHGINVSVVNFNHWLLDFDGIQAFQLNFRIHFEFNRESEVFTFFILARHVVWCASRVNLFFDDRVNKAALHRFAQHVLANGGAITLLNDVHRHMAFAETVDTNAFRCFDQLFFNSLINSISGYSNRETAPKALSGFY